jgi:hypothetical protein
MVILGFILNFLGGVLLIYYGDKTRIGGDRAAKDFMLSRWVFYAGVVCFCVGFILILFSMIFRG